ncbi:MAG: hypothetical protein PVJ98_10260 [Akkermansiaceae bacterium]
MSWIALTADHVKARLAEEELVAIEETGGGDGDRLTGIIAQVTALVRAKVAACDDNELGEAGTIPEECLHAAATIAKHDVRASLPTTGGEDEGDLRKEEYRNAMTFLNEVAKCQIGIVNPSGQIAGRESGCYGGAPLLEF